MTLSPLTPIVDKYEPVRVGTIHPTGARELTENEVLAWIDKHMSGAAICNLILFAQGNHYDPRECVRELAFEVEHSLVPDNDATESVILFFLTAAIMRTCGIPWARLSENAALVEEYRSGARVDLHKS